MYLTIEEYRSINISSIFIWLILQAEDEQAA